MSRRPVSENYGWVIERGELVLKLCRRPGVVAFENCYKRAVGPRDRRRV